MCIRDSPRSSIKSYTKNDLECLTGDESDIQINLPSEQEDVFEQDIEEPLEEDDSNFE